MGNSGYVALLFVSILFNELTRSYITEIRKIIAYLSKSATDMVCIDSNNSEVLVEIEYRLSSLFKHNHPVGTFQYVLCWDADIELNRARQLSGVNVVLVYENSKFSLKYDENKSIQVINLKEIVNSIIMNDLNKIKVCSGQNL